MRILRVFVALLVVCVLAWTSCSPASQNENNPVRVERTFSVQAQNFAPGQLEAHYVKHGAEFGTVSPEQYLANARALLNAMPGKDVLGKRRTNGDILRYRVSTGEFAVMTSAGRIRTYFRTDYRYWLRQ